MYIALLKAQTKLKEGPWSFLWDGLSQQVLDPGCATTEVALRPADGRAGRHFPLYLEKNNSITKGFLGEINETMFVSL